LDEPWLEDVAEAVETMGWELSEKWRNLASQHQALVTSKSPEKVITVKPHHYHPLSLTPFC
jgi:hypothetical protein